MMKHINPKIKIKKRSFHSAKFYSNEINNGNISALSEAITLIENHSEKYRKLAQEIIHLCLPHSGNSIRIGITGIPGVGKSTFIDTLGNVITSENNKIAVLTIDPSSQKSGGSILGDKTRMGNLSQNSSVFIRPSATSGTLGGVSKMTKEAIILCEAAGFNVIIIETVGVGQSETAVSNMVDFFLLLLVGGTGDELQGIKRGIMEMADGFVITKADTSKKIVAKKAKQNIINALHYLPLPSTGWKIKVNLSSSLENTGFIQIWEEIKNFEQFHKKNNFFEERRAMQQIEWMKSSIDEHLKQLFYSNKYVQKEIEELKKHVRSGKLSPFFAAKKLIRLSKKV